MNVIDFPISTIACEKISLTNPQWNFLLEAASHLPDVDWRRNALTLSQEEYCTEFQKRGPKHIQNLLSSFQQAMDRNGVCVLSFGHHPDVGLDIHKRVLAITISSVFRPFGAFLAKGFWQTLGVDPQAQNLRANSTGYIPFHFDLDQASQPPEYVGLYCIRADPFGGGENLVTDYRSLFQNLGPEEVAEIAKIQFSFSALFSTYNVGEIFNPHPLIDMDFKKTGDWACRYNGKARPQFADGSKEAIIFDALESAFVASSSEVLLSSGDLIIVDQRRVLHARKALADRPQDIFIPPEKDRLLLQIYGNTKVLNC